MYRFFKRLKKINKLRFANPKKKSILILDSPGSKEIANLINNKDFEILDLRNELNIPILISSILSLKKKTITQKYIESYIKAVKPKILITFIDNNISFFEIKLKDFNFKKIIIQNGIGIVNSLEKLDFNKKYEIDYVFVFNENYSNFYSKIIQGKTIVHGSLRNNFAPVSYTKKIKHDILFVSQFRDKKFFSNKKYSWEKWHKAELETIKIVNEFCVENQKKLTIAGFYQKDLSDEKIFYENILNSENKKCQYVFLSKENKNQTYELMDESNLVITIDSAMGYEGLTRCSKILFFNLRSDFLNDDKLKFGWPKTYSNEGEFWINFFDIGIMKKKITYLLGLSTNDWNQIKMRYIPELMCYDKENLKLKQLLSDHQNVQQ